MEVKKLYGILLSALIAALLIALLISCADGTDQSGEKGVNTSSQSAVPQSGQTTFETGTFASNTETTTEKVEATSAGTEYVTLPTAGTAAPVTVPSTETGKTAPVTEPLTESDTLPQTPVTEPVTNTTAAQTTAATAKQTTAAASTATKAKTTVILTTKAVTTKAITAAPAKAQKPLTVSELSVKNQSGVTANDGERYPWVELCALSDVELSGYSLSFDDGEPIPLPEKKLSAGELYLFFITKDDPALIKDGGKLALLNGDGVIEKFGWVNIFPDRSFVTNPGHECDTPTPGAENCKHSSPLVISEMMADNTKFPIDGALPDYIELYNASDRDINLSDYYISDKPSKPLKTGLPERTLKPGEYILLVCGTDLDFNLSKNGESVSISTAGREVIYSLAFTELDKNEAITPEGISTLPSPGYKNGKEGYEAYICSRTGLVISEVLPSNTSAYAVDKEYYDIIELYNASGSAIELSDYFLTDKMSEPERWRLPKGTLAPGAYKIIVFDGKGSSPPFSLGSDGETVKITRSDGYISDVLTFPALPTDISYGRSGSSLLYFDKPTPGKANGSGYRAMSDAPCANLQSGFYTGSLSISLYGDGNIYYTTDGTKPTASSKLYSGGPVVLSKSCTLRAICIKEGELKSRESSFTYLIDSRDYELPVISIAVKNADMFGSSGIWSTTYYNSTTGKYYNNTSEVEGRVTYIEDGEEKYSTGCGIKIFGGMTRYYKKKSLQLKFRAKYGDSEFNYPVFEGLDIDSFNSLVLRAGGQSLLNMVYKDEYINSIMSPYMPSVLFQAYKPVNVFINGEYYGVYFLREKIDDDFVASHEGCDKAGVTVIDHMSMVKYGSSDQGFADLWKYIKSHDLSITENYEYVESLVDIESLADFYIAQIWAANTDNGNVRMYKTGEPGSKWKFIAFDLDMSFNVTNGTDVYLGSYASSGKPYNPLIMKMLKNETFREYFLDRLDQHFSNTLTDERVVERLNFLHDYLAHDMAYEIARWKSLNSRYNQSVSAWDSKVAAVRKRVSAPYCRNVCSQITAAVKKIVSMKF